MIARPYKYRVYLLKSVASNWKVRYNVQIGIQKKEVDIYG